MTRYCVLKKVVRRRRPLFSLMYVLFSFLDLVLDTFGIDTLLTLN